MAENKPDEIAEDSELALPEIESLDDVKDIINDGIDKLKDSSVDDVKQMGLRVGNRIFKAWRQLTDGD